MEKPTTPIKQNRSIKEILEELWDSTKEWFRDLMDLNEGSDREGTIIAIKNNKRMRGSNAWLLMCSIMIASLGLDLNSPAVIIGAMLISPLMSPILGIGLGVGINDRDTLFISARHFLIAIAIALLTSTLYFLITPFGQITDEIRARTAPTVLDGLVAIFGGLAGIISTSRKDKSNAIPGVAIATALMPPLCVTGYGIANAQWDIMANSFYLFFLNSFFITITTYTLIKFLRFPLKAHMNEKEARRNRRGIIIFSLILIIPSAQILYRLWLEQQDQQKVEIFISSFFGDESNTKCIDYSLLRGDSTRKKLVLQLLGENIPEDSLENYYKGLKEVGLRNTSLSLIQDADLGLEQVEKMQLELQNLGTIANRLQTVNKAKSEQERKMEALQQRIDSLTADTINFAQVFDETKILFSDIQNMGFAKAKQTDFQTSLEEIPTYFIHWNRRKTRAAKRRDEAKLNKYLMVRTKLDTLQIVSY